jgi:uncharacterized protein
LVSEDVKTVVRERLDRIAESKGVTILYACESGSRAWGFPSPDSDYDIRFVYVHAPEWYLSVEEGQDVIETPIERHELGEIDLSGWELRKTLRLARKSNPVIWEWLQSPTVYRQAPAQASSEMLRAIDPCFSPIAACHHYLSICRGTMESELRGPEAKIKKYFYMLRPLLAAAWIERYRDVPPMEFGPLLALIGEDGPMNGQVRELLIRKGKTDERIPIPRLPVIDAFLESELARLTAAAASLPSGKADIEALDGLLRNLSGFHRGA